MSNLSVRAALVTPVGRGAVASIEVWGSSAVAIVQRHFSSATNRRLADEPPDSIFYGTWLATGEEIVVARPSDHRVEIHCHGGMAASIAILADLAMAGCEVVDWRQMIEDEGPNQARAAARIALASCSTERTANILLNQYGGAFERAVGASIEMLRANHSEPALAALRELRAWARFGRHLTVPWRVVIAGPANVGKSTLINALVGYQRAIVYDQPGTTRDVVTAVTAFDGWPFELADTAGLRMSNQPIEQEGIARAKQQMSAADDVLLVFDATERWTFDQQVLAQEWPKALMVFNKSDLLSGYAFDTAVRPCGPNGLLLSSKTGSNIAELIARIVGRLVPETPPAGAAIPFTGEQGEAIQMAIDCIERGNSSRAVELLVRLVS